MIALPKPQAYRREQRQGGQFVRWAYYPNPPGTPLYTEGQVRALLDELNRKRSPPSNQAAPQ